MASDLSRVIFASEAEAFIHSLECLDVTEIGGPKWVTQHEYIEKLNMQAVLNASQQEDEFVKEFLITFEKVSVLIHDLIATETWKHKVFAEFVNLDMEPGVMFPVYMVLYHEVTVANLLETVLFHRESAEAAEDNILDLVDYCYRKLTQLVALGNEDVDEEEEVKSITDAHEAAQLTSLEELVKQEKKLNFDICIKAVSMLRYIADHITNLPLSTVTRVLETHDVPILLVELIESPPWTRTKNGNLEKYMDTKWRVIPNEDRMKLTKMEGQVWLAIYQLLMREECQRKYELNSHRKNTLLKLRTYLHDVMLDQLPILADLRQYLEHLSIMDPPAVKRELILEQVPEIRDAFLKKYDGKWEQIAKTQNNTFFSANNRDIQKQAQRLVDTYNFDVLESLISEPPKCVLCGQPATKRCSRCQNEWYCRRECQVQHWKKHKVACDLLVNSLEKAKQLEERQQQVKTPVDTSTNTSRYQHQHQ